MFPLAVISDIHGNRWALEVILEDLEKRWVSNVVNLGDVLYGPLDPGGTADILMNYSIPTVCGNEDKILLEDYSDIPEKFRFTLESLSKEHVGWLKSFPQTETLFNILCFHGSPQNSKEYLLNKATEKGLIYRKGREIDETLNLYEHELILCGHDHIPNLLHTPGGKTIVNPGSVGLPAYDDDSPCYHIVENGSPHARYAIVNETEKGYSAEFIMLPYDYEKAVESAKKNHREDWAYWLKTGRIK